MTRDLNDTLVFVKVVQHGSITAAARVLDLPKTTVSRKLRTLEDRLGARLLNRTTRRLALTEAGTVYYEHSRKIAAELEEAESAVHQLEGNPRGWLCVTAPYSLGTGLLAPFLHEFRARYPEVRVEVVLSNDVLDLVHEGIDVALRIGDLPDSTLIARRLVNWPTRVFASEGYLARFGEPLLPEDLTHHQALAHPLHRNNHGYRWRLNDGNEEREFEVTPVVVANDPEMLLPLLAADQGLMLAPEVIVRCYAGGAGGARVRPVLDAWRGPDMGLSAVYVGGRVLSPKVRAFVDFVAEQLHIQCMSVECSALDATCEAPMAGGGV
jgi:LysR family transcriptional regulator, regulator for bpeEF and oprC